MLTTDQVIDRRILLQADALAADGWQVTILAAPGAATSDGRVVRVQPEGWRGVLQPEWTTLRLYRQARRFAFLNSPLLRRVRSAVWRHVISPDEFARRLMLPAAIEHQADVVVAHDLPILPTAVAAAKHHAAKLVYDSHELYCEQEFEPPLRRMWQRIERSSIGACDAVMTVNPSIARELRSRYGLARVEVVQNAERAEGPPPENERLFHRAFGLEDRAVIVLFQGGMLAGRNLESLVEAMTLVKAPSVHLAMLGDGALIGALAKRASAAGIGNRVHFHPAVPQGKLLRYTASADLGLIPYQATCLNNLYCTPNKLFEYVAAGIPTIATDLPELRRLIAASDMGSLIHSAAPQPIAAAIDELASDRTRGAQLRANTIAARQHLNWEQESAVLIDIFRPLKPH